MIYPTRGLSPGLFLVGKPGAKWGGKPRELSNKGGKKKERQVTATSVTEHLPMRQGPVSLISLTVAVGHRRD